MKATARVHLSGTSHDDFWGLVPIPAASLVVPYAIKQIVMEEAWLAMCSATATDVDSEKHLDNDLDDAMQEVASEKGGEGKSSREKKKSAGEGKSSREKKPARKESKKESKKEDKDKKDSKSKKKKDRPAKGKKNKKQKSKPKSKTGKMEDRQMKQIMASATHGPLPPHAPFQDLDTKDSEPLFETDYPDEVWNQIVKEFSFRGMVVWTSGNGSCAFAAVKDEVPTLALAMNDTHAELIKLYVDNRIAMEVQTTGSKHHCPDLHRKLRVALAGGDGSSEESSFVQKKKPKKGATKKPDPKESDEDDDFDDDLEESDDDESETGESNDD